MKKLAVFLLTGLTCASMLFGCGSKNDTVETVPVAEVQESTAAPAETESETETETVEEDVPPEEGMVKSDLRMDQRRSRRSASDRSYDPR